MSQFNIVENICSKSVIIMRGFPSTGKSTAAKNIKSYLNGKNKSCKIFSTDDYWYNNDKYCFDLSRLKEAHTWNQKRFITAVETDAYDVVVVDNTNVKKSDFIIYENYAKENNYNVYHYSMMLDPRWSYLNYILSLNSCSSVFGVCKEDSINIKNILSSISEDLAEISKKTHNVPQQAIFNMMLKWEN